jgi:hypothetical protein
MSVLFDDSCEDLLREGARLAFERRDGTAPKHTRVRRPSLASKLRVIKAAQKAGLPVKAATIDGVALTFGQVEVAQTPSQPEPRDEWDADLGPLTPSLRQ